LSKTERRATSTLVITILFLVSAAAGSPLAKISLAMAEEGSGGPGGVQTEKEVPATGSTPASPPAATLKAPDFTVKDLKGQTLQLSELLKKGPVFVDFWTSWCTPCKREMPELDRLHKTYRDRGFAVVAIAQDDTRTASKVKPYIDSNKFAFFAASDPTKSIGNAYNVRQYPTSFLIRQDGTVAYFAQAYLPGDEKKVEALVRELLGLEPADLSPGATK